MIDGQDGDVFTSVFGSQVTTIVSLVFLVVISFSMSDTQQRGDDRRTCVRGPTMTGSPDCSTVRSSTVWHLRQVSGRGTPALILADLDYFKEINDTLRASSRRPRPPRVRRGMLGRGAINRSGRHVMAARSSSCCSPGTDLDRAEAVTAQISEQLRLVELGLPDADRRATASRRPIRHVSLDTSIAICGRGALPGQAARPQSGSPRPSGNR